MIRAWWNAQSVRDRRVLVAGGIVVAILLTWALAWIPLSRARASLTAQVAQQRADVAWMRQSLAQARELRTQGARGNVARQGKSLLALADATARADGLGDALKRVEPTGAASVRVSFEVVDFDVLSNWLEALARDYGVSVTDLSVDKSQGLGLVNARVTLQDAKQ
ncbi:MAG: type II secretion system protein M [Proteobacteria bacterium]|nr:type II secretion system protein M [Pseudomonadota bacterium]